MVGQNLCRLEIPMYTIDLTVHPERRERALQRARERNIIIPTFAQMKDPSLVPDKVKEELAGVGLWDVDPRNLFRITWKNEPKSSGGGFGGGIGSMAGGGSERPPVCLLDNMEQVGAHTRHALEASGGRAILVPVTTVPVTIIGAFAAMALLDFSINTLTLFGIVLAIGIVVDDAIVVVENIYRRWLEEGKTDMETAVERRDVLGGPARSRVSDAIGELRGRLQARRDA